jgi:hypothetical protein
MRETLVSRDFLFFLSSDDIEAQHSLTLRSFSKQTFFITANKVYQLIHHHIQQHLDCQHYERHRPQSHNTHQPQQLSHQVRLLLQKRLRTRQTSNNSHHTQWITFALVSPSRWHHACPAFQDRQCLPPTQRKPPGAPTSFSPWSSQSHPSLLALRQSRLHAASRPTSDLVVPSLASRPVCRPSRKARSWRSCRLALLPLSLARVQQARHHPLTPSLCLSVP